MQAAQHTPGGRVGSRRAPNVVVSGGVSVEGAGRRRHDRASPKALGPRSRLALERDGRARTSDHAGAAHAARRERHAAGAIGHGGPFSHVFGDEAGEALAGNWVRRRAGMGLTRVREPSRASIRELRSMRLELWYKICQSTRQVSWERVRLPVVGRRRLCGRRAPCPRAADRGAPQG